MAAKDTTKARAKAASVAASDTTKENGASAPSSLATGVVGDLPTVDAANGKGETTGGGDDTTDGQGAGVDLASGNDGAVGAGDGASGDAATSVSGVADAGDQSAADGAGGVDVSSGGAGDLSGPGGSGGPDDGQSLTGDEGDALAAQAAGLALSAGGVGEALLALLDTAETEQTPSENGPAEPVISTAWAMPEIGTFPAHITLQNNTPSRVNVMNVRVEPYASVDGSIGEEGYARLRKSLAGRARLGKWDNLFGVQVKHDSND